jgi:hypothetical protein
MGHEPTIELVFIGTGAGATSVYHGEPSSAFLLLVDSTPTLLVDAVSASDPDVQRS